MIYRQPVAGLQPFIAAIWSCEAGAAPIDQQRELSLPAGTHHLVIRLGEVPLRLFGSIDAAEAQVVASAVVGGMRTHAVCKAIDGVGSVGGIVRADAFGLVREMSATDLSGRHTPLGDLGRHLRMDELIEQVETGATPEQRLDRFEQALVQLFGAAERPDPLMRFALRALDAGARIGSIVEQSGMSHRHFCARFRDMVGLPPSMYRQVRRFDRLLDVLSPSDRPALAAIACDLGYADQAHMAREFRACSGLAISQYERIAKRHPRHVPLPG